MQRTILGLFTILALAFGAPAVSATGEAGSQPLVSAQWLHDNLDRDDLVVLDIRNRIDGGDRKTFEAGHIPGAVYSSYTDDGWRTQRGDVPGMLPEVDDLEALIGGLGIDNDTAVVIVPAGVNSTDFGSATRVYWTFRVLGHDRVSILNGGHKAWTEAGLETESGWNEPVAATFRADFRPELIADADEVQEARQAGVQLVDNRPAPQYEGEEKHPAARARGTIPDSLNVQQQHLVSEGTAYMIDRETLAELLEEAEFDPEGQVVTFCNTGHWASLGWFALSEVLGHENVAMYDGSMTDWTQDESRPLQTASRGLGKFVDWLFN